MELNVNWLVVNFGASGVIQRGRVHVHSSALFSVSPAVASSRSKSWRCKKERNNYCTTAVWAKVLHWRRICLASMHTNALWINSNVLFCCCNLLCLFLHSPGVQPFQYVHPIRVYVPVSSSDITSETVKVIRGNHKSCGANSSRAPKCKPDTWKTKTALKPQSRDEM